MIGRRHIIHSLRRRHARTIAMAAAATALVGCSSGTPSTDAAGADTVGKVAAAAYTGPESQVPHAYPEPTVRPGFRFTVGLLNPTTAQPGLRLWQDAATRRAEALGGTMVALQTNADSNQQVDQFNQLLAQRVDAIIVNPVNAQALRPQLQQAAALDIPVLAAGLPSTVDEPPSPDVVTNAVEGFDQKAFHSIAQVAAAAPGSSFAVVGFGIPVPQLIYQTDRMKTYGESLGLTWLGQTDAAGDTASQYADAASTLLTRYPDLGTIACFNDSCAQAAAAVVRSSGRETRVTGVNGDPDALDLVESGQIFATAKVGYEELGTQLVNAAYNVLTEQNLPLPETVAIEVVPVTRG